LTWWRRPPVEPDQFKILREITDYTDRDRTIRAQCCPRSESLGRETRAAFPERLDSAVTIESGHGGQGGPGDNRGPDRH